MEKNLLIGIGIGVAVSGIIIYIHKKNNNLDITNISIAPEDAQRNIVLPKIELPSIKPFTIPTLKTPTPNNSIFSLKNLGKKELHF